MTRSATHSGYVPAIDSLRALAVLAVIVYHLHGPWLPGGFAGVDIFFVISGYVISRSMRELPADGFLRFAGAFYSRRIRRIMPALVVCLLITSLLSALFIPSAWLSDSNQRTGWYAYWGLSNFALLTAGDAYFAPRMEFNPFVHTWSLGVEEQFYLLFPAIFYGWLRARKSAGQQQAAWTLALLALLAASLIYCAYATTHVPMQAYYGLPSRFWELAAGAALLRLHEGGRRLVKPGTFAAHAQLLVSLAAIMACFCFARESAFPFPWALSGVAGTLGMLDLATADSPTATRINGWLTPAPIVWLGKISYSLYLWHWPVFVLARWTGGLDSWPTRTAAVALTLALAWASYNGVENPFRRGALVRRLAPRLVVAGGICCAFLAWSADKVMYRVHGHLSLSVTRDTNTWYPSATGNIDGSGPDACVTADPHGVDAANGSSRQKCDITGPATQVFVSGNSHALAYRILLSLLERRGPFDVTTYRTSGCALLSLEAPMAEDSASCRDFYQQVLGDMEKNIHPGDIVFLPSLRLPRLSDQWSQLPVAEAFEKLNGAKARRDRERALAEADGVLDALTSHGAWVILEAPKPVFRAPAFRCSDWFNRDNPVCRPGLTMSRDFLLQYRRPVLDAMNTLSHRHQHVLVWDPFNTLCPGDRCEAVANGEPLFFDADHVSANANRLLYPDFVEFLKEHWHPSAYASARVTPIG